MTAPLTLAQLIADWRGNARRAFDNSTKEHLPALDRRQCFGVSQAYDQCADELTAALPSAPQEPPQQKEQP